MAKDRHGNSPEEQGGDHPDRAGAEHHVEGFVPHGNWVCVGDPHVDAAHQLHHAQRHKERRDRQGCHEEPVDQTDRHAAQQSCDHAADKPVSRLYRQRRHKRRQRGCRPDGQVQFARRDDEGHGNRDHRDHRRCAGDVEQVRHRQETLVANRDGKEKKHTGKADVHDVFAPVDPSEIERIFLWHGVSLGLHGAEPPQIARLCGSCSRSRCHRR